MAKKQPQTVRLARHILQHGGKTTNDLMLKETKIFRYSARLNDLKKTLGISWKVWTIDEGLKGYQFPHVSLEKLKQYVDALEGVSSVEPKIKKTSDLFKQLSLYSFL